MTRHEADPRDELRRCLVAYIRSQGSPTLRAAAVTRLRALLEVL